MPNDDAASALSVFGPRPWTSPETISIGRLAMRSSLVGHPAADGARGHREASPWFRSLHGRWRFAYRTCPEDVTLADVAGSTDGWATIDVPGHWTLQGFDRPHYTNVQMPFAGTPPYVPNDNPTGVHRTTFTVPRTWRRRRVVLHVGSAESVLFVWVNGLAVGMGTDSRLSNEFDITSFLRPGPNDVALVVVKWSASSYVEDQDHWWLGGLAREVFLRSPGPVSIGDVRVDAAFDPATGAGSIRVRTTVEGGDRGVEAGWRVECRLETHPRRAVIGKPLAGAVPNVVAPYVFGGYVVDVATTVAAVRPWSAEHPDRYRLLVSLIDPAGDVCEVVAETVGFRTVVVRDRHLLINGQQVMIRGVNRHDHHPVRGKAVTLDDMRADLVTMKRHNVNAVRCSHYPNDHRFLDLCDELGLYVVDEANIESHAFNDLLCHDPRYRSSWLERGARMVQRDKNHPSVIVWSLGNEAGYGANHDALAGWIRSVDPSRPLHYEGAIMRSWASPRPTGGEAATDIVAPMYPPIDRLATAVADDRDPRPWILCEYSHAMGNSNGSLADYWELFESTPGLQGGFVWEWKDHGLRQDLPDGRWRYAYGGQFGDEPNDANFVADGLVGPDGTPHPAMRELAWVHRPVTVSPHDLDRRRVRIVNRQWFSTLDAFRAEWELIVDGVVVQRGPLTLPKVGPLGSAVVAIPYRVPATAGEAHLTVRFRLARATAWAMSGHEVAWDQFAVPVAARRTSTGRRSGGGMLLGRDGDAVTGEAGDVTMRVIDGAVIALELGGHELIAAPPRAELWRAALDNDGIKLWSGQDGKALGRWMTWGLDRLQRNVIDVHIERRCVTTITELRGADGAAIHTSSVRLSVDGSVLLDDELVVPSHWNDLPRVGTSLEVPAGFETVEWFGLGPHENEADRRSSAVVGRFRQPPDELPYLMPQDFGTRRDVRWLAVESTDVGLRIEPIAPRQFAAVSATHHRADDLYRAVDQPSLRRRDELIVHVDVAKRGVGTASCGPDTLDRYRVGAGPYRWRWLLRPYSVTGGSSRRRRAGSTPDGGVAGR